MLDYTRASVTKIRRDIHQMSIAATVVAQLFSICSLIYILIKGEGIFAIKLALLLLTSGYFLFYCITTAYTERRHKRMKKQVKAAFLWSRRTIKIVNLAIVIYGFVGAAHTPLSLLMFTFSAFSVVLDIAFGVLSFIIEGWTQLVIDGVEYDVGKLVNTFKPSNIFGRLLGKEEPEPELTPNQKLLDKIVQQKKTERAEKQATEKANKLSAKAQKKADKLAAKQAKKKSKRIPAPDLLEETAVSEEE